MGQRCVTERRGFWKHEIFIPLSSVFLQISFFLNFLFEDSPAEFIYAFCVVAVYLTRCFISRYFL